jgi:hypothetical protein
MKRVLPGLFVINLSSIVISGALPPFTGALQGIYRGSAGIHLGPTGYIIPWIIPGLFLVEHRLFPAELRMKSAKLYLPRSLWTTPVIIFYSIRGRMPNVPGRCRQCYGCTPVVPSRSRITPDVYRGSAGM